MAGLAVVAGADCVVAGDEMFWLVDVDLDDDGAELLDVDDVLASLSVLPGALVCVPPLFDVVVPPPALDVVPLFDDVVPPGALFQLPTLLVSPAAVSAGSGMAVPYWKSEKMLPSTPSPWAATDGPGCVLLVDEP